MKNEKVEIRSREYKGRNFSILFCFKSYDLALCIIVIESFTKYPVKEVTDYCCGFHTITEGRLMLVELLEALEMIDSSLWVEVISSIKG